MINENQWLSIKTGILDAKAYCKLIEDGEVLYDGRTLESAIREEPGFPAAKKEAIWDCFGDPPVIVEPPTPQPPTSSKPEGTDVSVPPEPEPQKPPPPSPCQKINALQEWPDFEDALDDPGIKDEHWEQCLGIPKSRISKIRRFVSQEANLDWDEIASESTQEIKETSKSTDVYFIGATSAGKSCILAALTNRLKASGDMLLNPDANLPGMQYTNYLSLCRDVQCLPDATGSGVAFATSMNVYHDQHSSNSQHSWNFVEMAGERVFKLQQDGNVEAINVNGWMNTRNAKIINFVVDPTFDASARGVMQDSLMNQAFIALSKEGVFERTTLVNILVNKFDLENPDKSNWKMEAKSFVQQHFSPLVNSLKNIQHKKGFFGSKKLFEIHVIPFSIGNDFSFSRYVHNWDWHTTDSLIEVLKRNTPHG